MNMINLLPPKEKDMLLMEKKKRIAIILWFLVLFFLICLILILFSIKVFSGGQIEVQKSSLAKSEKEFLQSETQELQEKINSANSIFKELSSFYQNKVYFSQILEKISKTIPENFYLTNLSVVFYPIEKEKKEDGTEELKEPKRIIISLSGFAPLRQDLLEFKKNLETEQDFKEIFFPASNWVEASNINFYVTFKIFP